MRTIAGARADRAQAEGSGGSLRPGAALAVALPRLADARPLLGAEHELATSRRVLGLARQIAHVLAEDSDLHHSLRALLRIVVEYLDLTAGAVLTLDAAQPPTVVASFDRHAPDPDLSRVRLAEDHGWVRLELASQAAALGVPLSDHGIRSVLAVPIRREGGVVGVVELGASPLRRFGPTEVQLVELMAEAAATALDRAALREQLRERERQVESLVRAAVDAQESERERICLDIHDGVAQTLAAVCQYQQLLEHRAELQGAAVRPLLAKTSSLIQRAIRETREVIGALRPAVLDAGGLVATLRSDLASLRAQSGWEVNFEADALCLPEPVETALYRIVHEAINNARKHSRTSRLDVSLRQSPRDGRVVAVVRDYGVGFDPTRTRAGSRGKRVGLLSMRRRAEALQGRCDVESTPGVGTTVRVEVAVPLDDAPAAFARVAARSLAGQQAS